MEEKKDFMTPPANNMSEHEKIAQLETQLLEMGSLLKDIKSRLKEEMSQPAKQAAEKMIKTVNPNATASNYYCHVNPPCSSYLGNSYSENTKSHTIDASNYSSDYADLVKENERLKEKLDSSMQWIDELSYNPGRFVPGQMNRNMMLCETEQINKSYRERLKGEYPIRCTYCDAAIFLPEDAYDDTFPVGEYGRDIFCQKCFKAVVSPARIQMVHDVLVKKNKKKKNLK